MPRNTRGGKKHKRGKNKRDIDEVNIKRMRYAGNDEIYAKVIRRLGGKRLELKCSDDVIRHGVIPGKLFKRVWMNPDDILLCQKNALGTDKECYILKKYTQQEVHVLKNEQRINFDDDDDSEEDNVKFDSNLVMDNKSDQESEENSSDPYGFKNAEDKEDKNDSDPFNIGSSSDEFIGHLNDKEIKRVTQDMLNFL